MWWQPGGSTSWSALGGVARVGHAIPRFYYLFCRIVPGNGAAPPCPLYQPAVPERMALVQLGSLYTADNIDKVMAMIRTETRKENVCSVGVHGGEGVERRMGSFFGAFVALAGRYCRVFRSDGVTH